MPAGPSPALVVWLPRPLAALVSGGGCGPAPLWCGRDVVWEGRAGGGLCCVGAARCEGVGCEGCVLCGMGAGEWLLGGRWER